MGGNMSNDRFDEVAKKANEIATRTNQISQVASAENAQESETTKTVGIDGNTSESQLSILPDNFAKTELEQIKAIEIMNTNFVFLFGGPQRGKTVVTASVVSFMYDVLESKGSAGPHNRKKDNKLAVKTAKDETGDKLLTRILRFRAERSFPERTVLINDKDPIYLNVRFEPNDARDHAPLNFTFLEMPGDTLNKILAPDGGRGDFPSSIDVFFRANDVSLSFILVTDWDSAATDDQLLSSFIEYVVSECDGFDDARFLLLVCKWDEYDGGLSLTDFLVKSMPLTYGKLYHKKHSMSAYSIGKVTVADNKPVLKEYNHEYPKKVLGWLYKNITGKSPYDLGLFRSILSKLKKYS
jgi:hypothetical protein